MSAPLKMIVSLAAAVASAALLATVRSGWLDMVDVAVLVVSLTTLTRTAIRSASDPDGARRRGW